MRFPLLVHKFYSSGRNYLVISICYKFKTDILGRKTDILGRKTDILGRSRALKKDFMSSIKPSMGKSLDIIKDRIFDLETLTSIKEIGDARFHDLSNPPSLQALKLHQVMFKAAGGAVAEDKWHKLDLSELRNLSGLKNHDRRSLIKLLKELRGVVMEYTDANGTNIAGLLDIAHVDFEDNNGPIVMRWKFGEGFREIISKSNYWAIIDRQTTFAMSSRYSLRLFEMISMRINLAYKASEIFNIDDLRARLGVPEGKLSAWNDFNKRALKPAIEEINQLARFTVAMKSIKRGKSVVAVDLSWESKTDLEETTIELNSHSISRKARRAGKTETIVALNTYSLDGDKNSPEGFPVEGTISFGHWGEIVRNYAPQPTPDVDIVAQSFRGWAAARNIRLSASTIEKSFIGFCKQYKL